MTDEGNCNNPDERHFKADPLQDEVCVVVGYGQCLVESRGNQEVTNSI